MVPTRAKPMLRVRRRGEGLTFSRRIRMASSATVRDTRDLDESCSSDDLRSSVDGAVGRVLVFRGKKTGVTTSSVMTPLEVSYSPYCRPPACILSSSHGPSSTRVFPPHVFAGPGRPPSIVPDAAFHAALPREKRKTRHTKRKEKTRTPKNTPPFLKMLQHDATKKVEKLFFCSFFLR